MYLALASRHTCRRPHLRLCLCCPALRLRTIQTSLGLIMSELRNTPAPIETVTANHPPVSCIPRNASSNMELSDRNAIAPGTSMNTPLAVAGMPGRPERFA